MNYESQSQDDLEAGDLAGAESPKNMNNILSGAYSKGNFGGPMKFKAGGPMNVEPEKQSTLGKVGTYLADVFKRNAYKSTGITHDQSVEALAENKAKKAEKKANNRVQK